MENTWEVSIAELINIYRNALIAVAPWAEMAKIPWRSEDSYDDWDDISGVLYKNIVLRSLLFSGLNVFMKEYGIQHNDYSDCSYIFILNKDIRCVFVSLLSINTVCDFIDIAQINDDGKILEYFSIPYENQDFLLSYLENGERKIVQSITVEV